MLDMLEVATGTLAIRGEIKKEGNLVESASHRFHSAYKPSR